MVDRLKLAVDKITEYEYDVVTVSIGIDSYNFNITNDCINEISIAFRGSNYTIECEHTIDNDDITILKNMCEEIVPLLKEDITTYYDNLMLKMLRHREGGGSN